MKNKHKENHLKRIIGCFLTIIILMVFILFAILELIPRLRAGNTRANFTKDSSSWMSKIDGSMPLSDISIPGAHDAGSNNVRLALFAKCQNEPVKILLEEGYRYLDIRLGILEDKGIQRLAIYHGFVPCLDGTSIFGSPLYLDSLLTDCYEFLEENPSETILFVVKKEYGDDEVRDFENLLLQYITDGNYSDMWLLTDNMPTLGQARGKLVLFRRYGDEASLGEKSGISLIWQNQDNVEIADSPCVKENNTETFYVQDRFNYDTDDKWNAFVTTANMTEELSKDGTVINFLSTSGSPKYSSPYSYSRVLNKRFVDSYHEEGIAGWVIIDYGTREMAEIVYSTNY